MIDFRANKGENVQMNKKFFSGKFPKAFAGLSMMSILSSTQCFAWANGLQSYSVLENWGSPGCRGWDRTILDHIWMAPAQEKKSVYWRYFSLCLKCSLGGGSHTADLHVSSSKHGAKWCSFRLKRVKETGRVTWRDFMASPFRGEHCSSSKVKIVNIPGNSKRIFSSICSNEDQNSFWHFTGHSFRNYVHSFNLHSIERSLGKRA